MYTTLARPARNVALTLVTAGIAVLGGVAIAPAASAAPPAQDGSSYVIDGPGNGGPGALIVKEHGRTPVFFCDQDKPNAHANTCITLVEDGGTRF